MSSSEDECRAKLPYKSKERYIAVYESFIGWKNERNLTSITEKILITYFEEISTKYKPSSLWAIYSMLKNTLKSKHNINLERFSKLTRFLKIKSDGYVGKKSKVLTPENVEKFIDEAPDDKYLVTKVALILGITGGLRRQELSDITVNHIENHGEMFVVKIPGSETKLPRTFVVQGKYYNIMKRYQNLRSKKKYSDRFFQHYRKGKCSGQVIGKNKFGNMPKEIAEYLKLPDANLYTGHTFRRTSTSLQADGGDLIPKRVAWKSGSETEQKTSSVDVHDRVELDSSEPTRKEPPVRLLEQCCFCGEFTKRYVDVVDRPYLAENRTTLAVNDLSVELDFNDVPPKSACLICDTKLKEMLHFVKLVKFAQETLINAETRPIETVIVKNECETNEDEIDDTKDEIDGDEINSMAMCETVYENESVERKRKSNSKTPKMKSKVAKENEQHEIIIDVKTEPIGKYDSTINIKQEPMEDDSVNSEIKEALIIEIKEEAIDDDGGTEIPKIGDMETDIKSSEEELATNASVNAMGDDNSLKDGV